MPETRKKIVLVGLITREGLVPFRTQEEFPATQQVTSRKEGADQ
jgi:hypothetical protein